VCAGLAGCAHGWLGGDHEPLPDLHPKSTLVADPHPAPPQRSATAESTAVRRASYDQPEPVAPGKSQLRLREDWAGMAVPELIPCPPAANETGPKLKAGPDKPIGAPGNGKPITLHVDELDVRKVLEVLSRQANLSIVISSGVGGKVTLDLQNKTADEVLQILAQLCRLRVRYEKDLVFVSALNDLRQIEEEDLPVRVYHLNYVRASDVEAMVKPLLSPRGSISTSPESEVGIPSDEKKAGGNSMAGGEILVVQDYEQMLKTIDRVIAQIDVQPDQVLIEAVIVSVKLDKDLDFGINYGLLDGAGKALGVMGDGSAINAAAGFTPASVLAAGGKLATGFATPTNGLKFGFVANNTTGFLSALETLGETKVLASPRLLVVNKQRAELQLGDRLGYQTATQTQTSTVQQVQFMDVGTLLRLRPFISSDGVIRMEIHPERSSGIVDDNGVPQTHSAQVTTNVMIPNGATLVIGGLIDNEINKEWEGLPLLSRLPVFGYLFRHTVDKLTRKELVVILTPHIWRPDCPQGLNCLGPPRSLGLETRVDTGPVALGKNPPTLYEIPPPTPCPPAAPCPSAEMPPE
jgi:general secretion pathway protein D